MEEDRFEANLAEMARALDPPPPAPREAMWAAIAAERDTRRAPRRPTRTPFPAWLRWAPALAAALVLGIALGRSSVRPTPPRAPVAESAAATAADPYAVTARRHLASAEALLVAFPEDARAGRTDDVARWAGQLLTDTRLLADSPAGDDPEVGRLLLDLELVLAQISALGQAPRGADVRLIEDGIAQNDVLVRLRAATGNGIAAGL